MIIIVSAKIIILKVITSYCFSKDLLRFEFLLLLLAFPANLLNPSF